MIALAGWDGWMLNLWAALLPFALIAATIVWLVNKITKPNNPRRKP